MEKVILFGAGNIAAYVLKVMKKLNKFEIVEVWDNDEKKHGMQLADAGEIKRPRTQNEFIVIVASVYFLEIKTGLMKDYGIREELIKPWEYVFWDIKDQIMEKYSKSEDVEIQSILRFLEKEELDIFNYSFKENYQNIPIKIEYDDSKGLFYTFWNEKKMYFSRKYSSVKLAENYVRELMIEQDIDSPHYYGNMQEYVKEGGVVVDAGAAEGIWALDVLDHVQKVILLECEQGWLEALQYTFEPYGEKVEIIAKPLVDSKSASGITMTELCQKEGQIACIKMDIEGAETDILQREEELLKTNALESLLVCTYHNSNDAQEIQNILCNTGYQTKFSKGYMFFPHGAEILPELRRGLIRAKK